MLSHLTLHHPPLFLLKLNLTSFISALHHPHAASPENQPDTLPFRFIRRSTAGRTSIPLFGEPLQTELPQRTLLLIARFGFSVMLIYTPLIFTTARLMPLILTTSRLTLYRFMQLIFTLHRLMLFHRKLFFLTSFRLTPLRRQLLRPFSSYPAPQHRNQFSIAFPNPRKTNLFHSQIIQFLRSVPLN